MVRASSPLGVCGLERGLGGSGPGVWALGFRVEGSRFRLQDLGFRG